MIIIDHYIVTRNSKDVENVNMYIWKIDREEECSSDALQVSNMLGKFDKYVPNYKCCPKGIVTVYVAQAHRNPSTLSCDPVLFCFPVVLNKPSTLGFSTNPVVNAVQLIFNWCSSGHLLSSWFLYLAPLKKFTLLLLSCLGYYIHLWVDNSQIYIFNSHLSPRLQKYIPNSHVTAPPECLIGILNWPWPNMI